MATKLLSLGKKLLLLAVLGAVVIAGVAAYEVHAWRSDRSRFAQAAVAPSGPNQLSFSVHFPDSTSAQVGEMIRVLQELRMQKRKLRSAEDFLSRSGWGSRRRKFSVPGFHFDRATGYARFGITIRARTADECYPILREIMQACLEKQPDLTGATLRIIDENGVRAEYVCGEPKPAAWPPDELPARPRETTKSR